MVYAATQEELDLIARVVPWAGGWRYAEDWYLETPIPSFGGRTACSLVKEGKIAAVHSYIDGLAFGSFV